MQTLDPKAARRVVNILQWRFPNLPPDLIRDVVLRVQPDGIREPCDAVLDECRKAQATINGVEWPAAPRELVSPEWKRQLAEERDEYDRHEWACALARFQASRKKGRKEWARSW